MNDSTIEWTAGTDLANNETTWYRAVIIDPSDGEPEKKFSVCKRNGRYVDGNSGGYNKPHTRWCVFDEDVHTGYCGDLPLDLSEDEVKAAALAIWRLR